MNNFNKILEQYSYETIQTLRYGLQQIVDGKIDPDTGICGNLSDQGATADSTDLFHALTTCWPKFSGSEVYPLPGSSYAFIFHLSAGGLWEGEQKELRLELCNFILSAIDAY